MDEDEEYEYVRPRPSRQLRWQLVAAMLFSGTGAVITDIADTFEGIAHLLMSDGNYAEDRTAFHEEAALELETMLEDGDG